MSFALKQLERREVEKEVRTLFIFWFGTIYHKLLLTSLLLGASPSHQLDHVPLDGPLLC